jgi:hypothetical protein
MRNLLKWARVCASINTDISLENVKPVWRKTMSDHDSEHAHEPEDESIGVKVGIFFILVLVALYFIAL